MTSPRSVRFEPETVTRLASFAARHSGLTNSGAAALLVEEGLRMDAHPGVVFREGPSGRRAVLAGGPDVWEVIRAIRDTRDAEPELDVPALLDLVGENSGVPIPMLRIATTYYGAFPAEIDIIVKDADEAEAELERVLRNTDRLLGA